MNDLISRQQVIELLEYEIELLQAGLDDMDYVDYTARSCDEAVIKALQDDVSSIKDTKEFPPVHPEPKPGHWHLDKATGAYTCSCCGESAIMTLYCEPLLSDYCPDCGAHMLEEDEDDD